MLAKVFLLLLPAVAYASIHINIKTGTDESIANVTVLGSSVEIIPDGERSAWKLNDRQLKDAVEAYSGKRPTHAYLKSPTPWGDLYQTYGWPQVQRTLVPINARILGIHNEPVIIATQDFINNSSAEATFTATITQNKEDTVSTTWTKGGNLEVGQEIHYSIELGVGEAGGSTTFSFSSSWGEETSKSQTVTVGSSSGVEIKLDPGQSVTAALTATRGTMEVQVDYRANLDGAVACNYEDKYEDHFFWGFDVTSCLDAAGYPMTIDSTETLKIGYYTNGMVTVADKVTSHILFNVTVPIKRVNTEIEKFVNAYVQHFGSQII
ncbi:spherulin-2A-like [Phthorimaea operculella]|nr:spherulin-2A-like [Phthorimaea operculella]